MAALLVLAACGQSGSAGSADRLPDVSAAPTAPPATASAPVAAPATPLTGPQAAVAVGVLSAYRLWWDARTAAFGQPEGSVLPLQLYSSGQALSDAMATVTQLGERKLVMVGSPRHSPLVTAVDPDAKPPTATVEDCLDVSDWHQADAKTKAIADPKDRLTRYAAKVTLRKSESRWLIVEFNREVGRTC
ncbi:hypothetical protein ACIRBX_16140 [Kitasatospora sp. NPDC096147]|uniref:hypothetical protein n=1 Tax=Kitasatospora sp. NPDC096147 TaxID=3364093 RepID=UPI003813B7E4